MRIAANTRFMIPGNLTGFGHYTYEIMSRMVQDHPEDHFQFYFDRKFPDDYLFGKNVSGKVLSPPARHPVLFYLWYQHILRRAMKSYNPDVFFSPGSFMPLGMKYPSVITVHDIAHQRYPEAISYSHRKYYDHFLPKFISEATKILTVSHFSKSEIMQFYPESKGKIEVIYNGVNDTFRQVDPEVQQSTRTELTGGLPYFLFVGAIHPRKNVAKLIEAYSLFRAIHNERYKLVIVGPKSWNYTDVGEALAASEFSNDIEFTGYMSVTKLPLITASAVALCYIPLYEGFGLPVAEAMRCGIPVIVTRDSAQSEVAGDAGLTVDPLDTQDIAQKMVGIASDHGLRNGLIEAGLKRSDLFSWDRSAAETYNVLREAVQ